MEVRELPFVSQQFEIGLRQPNNQTFNEMIQAGQEIYIQKLHSTNEDVLVLEDRHWPVVGLNDQNKRLLETLLFENRSRLCWVDVSFPKNQDPSEIYIKGRSFIRHHVLTNNDQQFVIGISDWVFDDLHKLFFKKENRDRQRVVEWLRNEFIISSKAGPCFLISSGDPSNFNLEVNSFRLHGRKIALIIDRTGGYLKIERIIRSQRANPEQAVILMQGELAFHDISVAFKMEKTGLTELDAIIQQSAGSYLGIWKEYNQIERTILQDRARQAGWLDYKKIWPIPEGWRLEINKQPGNARRLEEFGSMEEIDLEVASELPKEMQLEEEEEITSDDDGEIPSPVSLLSKEVTGMPVKCVGIDAERMTIDIRLSDVEDERVPPELGVLFVSVSGDRYRLRRREFAWQRVRFMQNPIPGLGFLLEQSLKFLTRDYKARKISSKDLRKYFEVEPTDRQRMAIQAAINTPDIALIQGPPGTGKTRVITALNKALSDEQSFVDNKPGSILLTSYQHDAVENVAGLSSVYGLPAIKIGNRRTKDKSYDPSTAWRKKLVEELLNDPQRQITTPVRDVYNRVKVLMIGYVKSPPDAKVTGQILRDVLSASLDYISLELRDSLIELIHQVEMNIAHRNFAEDAENQTIVQATRRLRIEQDSFNDDGARNALILKNRLKNLTWVLPDDLEILSTAADWVDDENLPPFLPKLADLQARILDRYIKATPLDKAGLVNADVERILTLIIEALYQYSCDHPDNAAELVTQRFIFDLENDPQGAFKTLESYSFVLAATCQQSVGQSMQRRRRDEPKESNLDFDTVIVDEASRSNPLDLLIPLSLARRRIILVGDHRQLPHMLEPSVEKKLNQSSNETQDYLRMSLFERLFRHLQDLQKQDGITRTITLDRQYRMHPILGEFVSDTFYKPHGEGFHSDHLNPIDYSHEVHDYLGKVAVWKHLSNTKGSERGGQSKFRVVEARWIASETRKILDTHPHYSVGIITFYSTQVQQILKEMAIEEIGLTEQVDGIHQIKSIFLHTSDGEERLRVGIVDAFQGKEFDIVLLSLVRSNGQVADDEASLRRKYGFLTLENRLCVAMSRQKKLLIVVGDADMLTSQMADKAVHGLVAFHQLCGGDHGIRISA
jgi:hypothetical protein